MCPPPQLIQGCEASGRSQSTTPTVTLPSSRNKHSHGPGGLVRVALRKCRRKEPVARSRARPPSHGRGAAELTASQHRQAGVVIGGCPTAVSCAPCFLHCCVLSGGEPWAVPRTSLHRPRRKRLRSYRAQLSGGGRLPGRRAQQRPPTGVEQHENWRGPGPGDLLWRRGRLR